MLLKLKNYFGDEVEVVPSVGLYTVKDFVGAELHTLAFELECVEDGDLEPYATLTTNFGEYIGIKNCAYIDTNNNPFAEAFLQKNNIATPTGLVMRSGFVDYPLYRFNEDFLREVGGSAYQTYSTEYDDYMAFMYGDLAEEPDEDSGMSEVQ